MLQLTSLILLHNLLIEEKPDQHILHQRTHTQTRTNQKWWDVDLSTFWVCTHRPNDDRTTHNVHSKWWMDYSKFYPVQKWKEVKITFPGFFYLNSFSCLTNTLQELSRKLMLIQFQLHLHSWTFTKTPFGNLVTSTAHNAVTFLILFHIIDISGTFEFWNKRRNKTG